MPSYDTQPLLTYGATLGRQRQGCLLAHDYDLDFLVAQRPTALQAVLADAQVADACTRAQVTASVPAPVLFDGYLLDKVRLHLDDKRFDLDFFTIPSQGPSFLHRTHVAPFNHLFPDYFRDWYLWRDPEYGCTFPVSRLETSFAATCYRPEAYQVVKIRSTYQPVEPFRPVRLLTAGCFDPLHAGHVEFLSGIPKQIAGPVYLTVALPSDDLMRRWKREPRYDLEKRRRSVEGVKGVDATIVVSDWQELPELVTAGRYDMLVESEEYRGKDAGYTVADETKRLFVPASTWDLRSSRMPV